MARKPLEEGRPDTSFEGYDRPSRSGIVSSLRARRDQTTAVHRHVLSTLCHPAMIGMREQVQNAGSAMLRPSVPGGSEAIRVTLAAPAQSKNLADVKLGTSSAWESSDE